MSFFGKKPSILPGFGIALGFTVTYLSLIVLIPMSMLFIKTADIGLSGFLETITSPRVAASFRLSLWTSLGAAVVNTFFGLITAWVLVRYRFPGKKVVDALIDLPFALPTAVAGITLTTIYSHNGFLGHYLEGWGIKVAYTPLGILVALVFIGLPFVVRAVQPVLEDLEPEFEEAAGSLGASRWQIFRLIILPAILPALLTGFSLTFARGIGEYGSVIFIAGNMPMFSEITPLLIVTKLEQFEYAEATAIAVAMLLASFAILLAINLLQWWLGRRVAFTPGS